jgi:hypothetical protein
MEHTCLCVERRQVKFDTGIEIISRLDEMLFAFLETEKVKDSALKV